MQPQARIRSACPKSASLEAEPLLLLVLEALGAGVEFFMGLLKAVVLTVQSHATHRLHSISAEITFLAAGLLGHQLADRVHCLSPKVDPFVDRSRPPSIADLEAKLSWRLRSKRSLEGSQEFRLAKLQLLGPDGAVDLEFQDLSAKPDGSTMHRDSRTHRLLPDRSDLMGSRDAIEAQIAEHLADDITDRRRLASSPRRPATHRRSPGSPLPSWPQSW